MNEDQQMEISTGAMLVGPDTIDDATAMPGGWGQMKILAMSSSAEESDD